MTCIYFHRLYGLRTAFRVLLPPISRKQSGMRVVYFISESEIPRRSIFEPANLLNNRRVQWQTIEIIRTLKKMRNRMGDRGGQNQQSPGRNAQDDQSAGQRGGTGQGKDQGLGKGQEGNRNLTRRIREGRRSERSGQRGDTE